MAWRVPTDPFMDEMTNPWMRIAVFDARDPAVALGAHLQENGFEVRLNDERNLQRFWFFTRPRAGFSVEVQEDSFARVKKSMASDPKTETLLQTAIRCPSCHSTRVEYPQMARKNLLPTLLAHTLIAFHVMEPQCYCESCHYTWRPPGQAGELRPESGAKA